MRKLLLSIFLFLLPFLYGQYSDARSMMKCDTLAECGAELRDYTARYENLNDTDAEILHYGVANSFGRYGDEGWNQLFVIMENTRGEAKKFVIDALGYLSEKRKTKFNEHQWQVTLSLWSQKPSLSLGEIISSYDTIEAHGVLITALESPDKNAQFFARDAGVGRSNTELSDIYLSRILDLLQVKEGLFHVHGPFYVDLLARIQGPIVDNALWDLLSSDDVLIFPSVFDILKKQNWLRLGNTILRDNSQLTSNQKQRAIMLGKNLWETGTYYNTEIVTDRDIDFYERLYLSPDLSPTSKLIPFTVLNTMRKRTYGNDHNKSISPTRARLIKRIDDILVGDEDVYREYYFASFEVEIKRMYRLRMSDEQSHYHIFYKQIFPPSEYIKTPEKWAVQMRKFLHDERLENYRDVLDFLIKYDTDTDFMRSQLLPRLDGENLWRDINHALMLMSQREKLRTDPELRRRAQQIEKTHIFTIVRAAARHVLADSKISAGLRQSYITGYLRRDNDAFAEVSKIRRFCEPPDDIAPSTLSKRSDLPEFPEFDYLTQYYLGVTYSARDVKRTSNGWLAGYNRGEFGGGLAYYPDDATQGVIILRGTPHNVVRIMKSDKEGVYWVLTGLNHLFDSGSVVHRVEIKNGEVKSDVVKRLPKTPEKTFVTKDGDLFIDFWHRSYMTSDGNMQTTTHLNSKYKYNPPLLFTKTGELRPACETTPRH